MCLLIQQLGLMILFVFLTLKIALQIIVVSRRVHENSIFKTSLLVCCFFSWFFKFDSFIVNLRFLLIKVN